VVPVGDDRSRQFEVRIALSGGAALVGTPVEVSLPATSERIAVTVPPDALVIHQSRSNVLRVTRANTLEQLDVIPSLAWPTPSRYAGRSPPTISWWCGGAERLAAGQAVKVIATTPAGSRSIHSG
jgi:membrane fusion protein, multidrug efflux system